MFALFSQTKFKQLQFWTALGGLVLFLFVVGAPAMVHAQGAILQNLEAAGGGAGLGTQSIYALVGKIIRIVLGTLGIIAIGITIYAGFLWMTARGKEDQIEKAKDILRNGVIGLVIIFSAFGITEFIMSKLLNATGTSGEITDSGAGGSGADLGNYTGYSQLGKVVESHDPARDEKNVMRNKNIQVIFKFPIDLESIIDTSASGVVKKNNIIIAGPMKAANISIYPTKEGKAKAYKSEDVIVFPIYYDNGMRGFVLDVQPVFDPNISYTVELGVGIQKAKPNTTSAFSGFSGGYLWKFETGSDLDNTPPRITSVIPVAGGTFDRNITIQLTFSESVNMASSLGDYDPASKDKDGNPDKTFVNISARTGDGADTIIKGSWRRGAGFNVIEFTPFELCGKNSCGMDMFCLPAKSNINTRALAGLLKNKGVSPEANILSGYQGVVDSANNALDGGGENGAKPWSTTGGTPQGSSTDDFFMKFNTTDKTKLTGPEVMSVAPAYSANSKSTEPVNATSPVIITFDSIMKSSTFGDIELLAKNPLAQAGFWMESANKNVQDKDVTVLNVKHVDFAKKQDYGTVIPSSVLDIYQNCFLPAAGPGCSADSQTKNVPATLYCCNGKMSSDPCPEQTYGQKKK